MSGATSPSKAPALRANPQRTPPSSVPAATLELWQTEWCPASHRVRQRLTELGVSFTVHQVPVERDARTELVAATGAQTIPAMVVDGEAVCGEDPILSYLSAHFIEPPDAPAQRARAEKAKRKELEEACPKLQAATR